MATCCPQPKEMNDALLAAKFSINNQSRSRSRAPQPATTAANGENMELVRMKYTGQNVGSIPFIRVQGQPLSKTYRGGNNTADRYADATPDDAVLLEKTGKWERVARAATSASADGVPLTPVELIPEPAAEMPVEEGRSAAKALADWSDTVDEMAKNAATAGAIAEAEKLDIPLLEIEGTGANGRITVADVRKYAKELSENSD